MQSHCPDLIEFILTQFLQGGDVGIPVACNFETDFSTIIIGQHGQYICRNVFKAGNYATYLFGRIACEYKKDVFRC